jgi:hypothetical protein
MYKNKVAAALNTIIVRCDGLPTTTSNGVSHSEIALYVVEATKDLGLCWDSRLRQFVELDETKSKAVTKEVGVYVEFAMFVIETLEEAAASHLPMDLSRVFAAKLEALQEDVALNTPITPSSDAFLISPSADDLKLAHYTRGPFPKFDMALEGSERDGAVIVRVSRDGKQKLMAIRIDSIWHKL